MTVPSIRLSEDELGSNTLDPITRLLAQQVFTTNGVLIIENAFAPAFIESLKQAFLARYARRLVDQQSSETLKVGDKRIMVPVEIAEGFNTPQLYANPFVLPLVQDLLGVECILGSFGAVTALPGAEDQHVHRDHPMLFQDQAVDTIVPAYAINVVVPLVDMNDSHGTTRVWPGSHRVWTDNDAKKMPHEDPPVPAGSCILMDYRLLHGGTVNRSQQLRPILYLIYHRPWFKDYVNFVKVKELVVPDREYAKIPNAYQRWFKPGAGDRASLVRS